MRINLKRLYILISLLPLSDFCYSQIDSITTRENIKFEYIIKSELIPQLQQVLAFIADKTTGPNEVQTLIENKTKGVLENRLFADDKIIVENDLQPGADTNIALRNDFDVVQYLNAFNTSITKSEQNAVELTDIQVSPLKKRTYFYYNVVFTTNYYSTHSSGKKYDKFKRVAEVSVERDTDWHFFIRGIRFATGNELDSSYAFKGIVKIEGDIEKILNAFRDEVQQKEKLSKQNILRLRGEGDDFYDKGDFENALRKYREAWIINISDRESNESLAKVKSSIDKKRKEEIAKKERDSRIVEMTASVKRELDNYNFKSAKLLCDSLIKDFKSTDSEIVRLNDELSQVNASLVGIETAKERKDVRDAARRCQEKIEKEKNDIYKSEYYYQMALIYLTLDKSETKKIMNSLTQSIDLSHNHHQLALKARVAMHLEKDDIISAIEDASQMINNDSRNPQLYIDRAQIHIKNNNSQKALDDYSQALLYGERGSEAYKQKAILEFSNMHYADVIKTCSDGIEKNYSAGWLYYYRGLAKEKQSGCFDAGNDFRKAISYGISDSAKTNIKTISDGYSNAANASYANKEYTKAIAEYNCAIGIDSSELALYKRAWSFINISKPDSALNMINPLLSKNISFPLGYSCRGYAELALKKFSEAQTDFETEIKRSPPDYNTLYGHGLSCFYLEKYELALRSFEKAIEINVTDSAWHYVSYCHYNLKKYDKAIEYGLKAQKIGTQKFKVYYITGRSYYDSKNYSDAIKTFSKAFSLVSFDDSLYLYYASAFENNKDYPAAITAYNNLSKSVLSRDTAFYRTGVCEIKSHEPSNLFLGLTKLIGYTKARPALKHPEAYSYISYAYLNLDSLKQANEFLEKAKTDGETNYMTQYVLACMQTKNSMFDDAFISLDNALASKLFTKPDITSEKLLKPLFKKDRFKELMTKYFR